MPQFDSSSFIVQLVWLFLSFLSFYFVFSLYILPLWGGLIKTRKKTTKYLKNQTLNIDNSILAILQKNSTKRSSLSHRIYF